MRIPSLVVAGGAVLLAGVGLLFERPASAKDAEAVKVGQAVLEFAKGTVAGGEFGMEIAADGSLGRLESQVALDSVPKACLDAAAKHAGGGTTVRADKQWVAGNVFWQVTHDVGGLRHETLMKADGTVVGSEVAVNPAACAQGMLDASEKAAPGSELVAVERVTGPEALGGTEWHVKRKLAGEVLRISVLEDGSIGRVYRKIPSELKILR